MRKTLLSVLAALALVTTTSSAEAGKTKPAATAKSKSKAKSTKTSKSSKADKLAAAACAKKPKKGSKAKKGKKSKGCEELDWHTVGANTPLNMPPGWQWPPSAAMVDQGQACLAKLDELGVKWEKGSRDDGHIVTPIVVPSMTFAGVQYESIFRPPPFTMDCHLALALTNYGQVMYDLGVRKVMFSSVFRNTRVRVGGHTKNALSRHALGLAVDIARVVDVDGNTKVVGSDYKRGDELLKAIEQVLNESGGFRTVLTPKNDPISHKDHFHIEARVEYPRKPTS